MISSPMRMRAILQQFDHRLILLWLTLTVLATSINGVLIARELQIVFAPFDGVNDFPQMQVANADGSSVRSVLPAARNPNVLSLVVDPRDRTIYYGTYAAEYEIRRVGADGAEDAMLYSLRSLDRLVRGVANATPSPYGISLDTLNDKLYWVGGGNNSGGTGPNIPTFIQRANLDGTSVEIVRQSQNSDSSPYSLVVDGVTERMYWTDMSDDSIRTAHLDGSEMEIVLQRDKKVGGLAIDFGRQIMFWSELAQDRRQTNIMSAELDGSGVDTLHSVDGLAPSWFGMPTVIGMTVDSAASQLYFADSLGESVSKINYDGSDVQLLIADTPRPFGIGVFPIPEPTGLGLALLAFGCSMTIRRLTRK